MKVYTKTGDQGQTSLLNGERVNKESLRVEAYGTIDEINSALGLSRATAVHAEVGATILKLQKMLMGLMAELASGASSQTSYVTSEKIQEMETWIDQYTEKLAPLQHFIIPGDVLSAAYLDLARTVTRRAERAVWRLSRDEEVPRTALIILNRLSDLCFTLGRYETEVQ